MRLSDDTGMSLAELLVVVTLMSVILAAAYMGLAFATSAQGVAERQSQFARDVTAPLDVLDAAFSQSTMPTSGATLDAYSVSLRMPDLYTPGFTVDRDFTAGTDGKLVERDYRVVGINTRTLTRTIVWSTTNANRTVTNPVHAAKPIFSYYVGSVAATSMLSSPAPDNVKIEVASMRDGKLFSDTRRVFFRNR